MRSSMIASVRRSCAAAATSVPDSSATSAPARIAASAASSWGVVSTIAPMPSESVTTRPSKPWRPRSSSVIAARDSDAGSSTPVSPGTTACATMIPDAPASMARSNGIRSLVRSSSMGARSSSVRWGSESPPPMPGQCLTTEADPAPSWAEMIASVNEATVDGSSPKLREPRSDPDPTSRPDRSSC